MASAKWRPFFLGLSVFRILDRKCASPSTHACFVYIAMFTLPSHREHRGHTWAAPPSQQSKTYTYTHIRRYFMDWLIEAETKWPPFFGRHFKCIFLNENVWISLMISPKIAPHMRIVNIPALVQIMYWRLTGDKPLYEPMLARFVDAYTRHWGERS